MAELTDLKGVGKSTAESLDESGYSTVKSVATATPPELSAVANTGKGKAYGADQEGDGNQKFK